MALDIRTFAREGEWVGPSELDFIIRTHKIYWPNMNNHSPIDL